MPIIGNEDTVVPIEASIDLELKRRFQGSQAEQCVPVLHIHPLESDREPLALHERLE